MNIFVILIIIFLCVYLINKFFNLDEIKKYIFALIAFFTLTNNTYPVKHGGANENMPDEKSLPLIRQNYNDITKPFIYPYIFKNNIIVDGFNIFITMNEKLIEEYKSQNEQRDPTEIEIKAINRSCFEKMITELNRCFEGTLHLIIKTGQDNIMAQYIYGETAITLPPNIIIYDAFYDEADVEQKSSIDNILSLSEIEKITKYDKKELHRLKSLDDHMLMLVASNIAKNNKGHFTIVSRDKYREIRKIPRELPNKYKICIRSKDILTYRTIDPNDSNTLFQLNALLTREDLYLYILAPVINKYGEIILFSNYKDNRFEYDSSQVFMLHGKSEFMQNLYNKFIKILESIQESWKEDMLKKNAQESWKEDMLPIKNEFDSVFRDNLLVLDNLIQYNSITRPDCKDFPSIIECKNDMNSLKDQFNLIFENKYINDNIYEKFPPYIKRDYDKKIEASLEKQTIVLNRILSERLQKLEEAEEKSAKASITYAKPITLRTLKK